MPKTLQFSDLPVRSALQRDALRDEPCIACSERRKTCCFEVVEQAEEETSLEPGAVGSTHVRDDVRDRRVLAPY